MALWSIMKNQTRSQSGSKTRTPFKNKPKKTTTLNSPAKAAVKAPVINEHKVGYFQTDLDVVSIYVGNLRYTKDEHAIKEMFAEFGSVKYVKLVVDPKTDKSKGIAFVQMPNKNAADQAIQKMNGKEVDGRTLKVSIAKERNPEARVEAARKTEEARVARRPKKEAAIQAAAELEAQQETKSNTGVRRRDRKRNGLKQLFTYLGK